MSRIKFTARAFPDPDLTTGKLYSVKAFSKWRNAYLITNDAGYENWYYAYNFELTREDNHEASNPIHSPLVRAMQGV